MSEWWTYRLSSFLMFSPRTYYRLFELYNAAIWLRRGERNESKEERSENAENATRTPGS